MQETIITLLNEIVGADEGEIESDLDLFEAGLLDSFGIVQLFVELEERLGVTLDVENISREEIATPARIAACVERVR